MADLNFDGLEISDEAKAKLQEQADSLVTGDEFHAVKTNRDELLGEKKKAQQAQTEAEKKAEAERLEKMEKDKKHEALAAEYKNKLAEYEEREQKAAAKARQATIAQKAQELAAQISDGDNTALLATFIKPRLDLNEAGDLVVLDPSGNPTISKPGELVAEFKADKKYSALVTATKATGGAGGPNQSAGPGGARTTGQDDPMSKEGRKARAEQLLRENGLPLG